MQFLVVFLVVVAFGSQFSSYFVQRILIFVTYDETCCVLSYTFTYFSGSSVGWILRGQSSVVSRVLHGSNVPRISHAVVHRLDSVGVRLHRFHARCISSC